MNSTRLDLARLETEVLALRDALVVLRDALAALVRECGSEAVVWGLSGRLWTAMEAGRAVLDGDCLDDADDLLFPNADSMEPDWDALAAREPVTAGGDSRDAAGV